MRARFTLRLLAAVQAFLLVATLVVPALVLAEEPTDSASQPPTEQPSDPPTAQPSDQPTAQPSDQPSSDPSSEPTAPPAPPDPTPDPTSTPTPEPIAAPTVASDKADYAPGELVTLTGVHWAAGESVHVYINDEVGSSWSRNVDVIADSSGNLVDQFNLPSWFVSNYVVVATGQLSGVAMTSFTDGTVSSATIATREATCTTAQGSFSSGSTVCAHVVATIQGGGTTDWRIQWYAPGVLITTGTPAKDEGFTESAGTTTSIKDRTFAVAATGTWTIVVCKTTNAGSCSAGNQVQTATFVVSGGNSAPVIARTSSTVTVNEGQTATNTGTWSDANAADTVTLTASVGTVTKAGTNASGTWNWSYATTDGPTQSQTVTISANDGNGGVATTTFTVTVSNVNPSVSAPANQTSNEGENKSFTLGSFSDPGSDSPWAVDVDWGDGSGHTTFSSTGAGPAVAKSLGSQSHAYADNGAYTVTVKVTDKDAGFGTASFTVTVSNVAPTVSTLVLGGNLGTSCSGGNMTTLTFSFSDPGVNDNPWTVTINWGDGSQTIYNTATQGVQPQQSHSYGAGTFTITVTVKDKDLSSGSNSSTTGAVSHLYNSSGFLQPINLGDQRSSFKIGSTIPVKLRITDCNGTLVTGLVLTVHLQKSDSTPEAVNEAVVASNPDPGITMRLSGDQYIFNLSTKLSQFNGGADLTQGTYHLWVTTSPSVTPTTEAYIDTKK